jgi:hypothetical protein
MCFCLVTTMQVKITTQKYQPNRLKMCHSSNIGNYSNSSKFDSGKWRLNSGNACYNSLYNLLSTRLLSKNVKIY